MSDLIAWVRQHLPSQTGKTAVVTGANSGIGYEAARGLAHLGAHVVLACRSRQRADEALKEIEAERPVGTLEVRLLDLGDLASVRAFAEGYDLDRLDVLLNNAGLMALPYRKTEDGFEMQFGVNHLGHFALTGLLLPHVLGTPQSRVVTVSSIYHKRGAIDFGDLQHERSYNKWEAYAQSKLANLLFALELDRRLKAHGADALSVGAHPGYAATELQRKGPEMAGGGLQKRLWGVANVLFAQAGWKGALPLLHAAADPSVQGGGYYGPDGFLEARGEPAPARIAGRAKKIDTAERLWTVSEELTGVRYDFEAPDAGP